MGEMKEDEVMTTVSNLRQESQALFLLFFTAATQIEMLSCAIAVVCGFKSREKSGVFLLFQIYIF